MGTKRNTYRTVALVIVLVAFAAAALSYLLPVAPTVIDETKAQMRTAAAVVLAVLFTGAAIWYWNGLQHYKSRLRVVYILLGISMVLFSVAMLQLPIFGLFDLWKTRWATGGGAILLFILSTIPMYLSMRLLGRLAGVKSKAGSLWFVTGVTVVVAVCAAIVSPHFIRHNMVGAPAYVATVIAASSYIFFSGIMAYRSMQALGPSYTQALKAQVFAFFFLALSALNEAVVVTFMPRTTTFYSVDGVYLWSFIIAGFLFVRACYYFHLLTEAYDIKLTGDNSTVATDDDYVDSIVNVANLASRVDHIDPMLDPLRELTSSRAPGHSLSSADKDKLLAVFRQVSDYLVTSDPLRAFTYEQLLYHVTPAFNAVLDHAKK